MQNYCSEDFLLEFSMLLISFYYEKSCSLNNSFWVIVLIWYHRSKIVFKTAGVLLDEMQEKGMKALNYKVIILDEVHERSVESDLVLVCVKQLMLRNNDLRLVDLLFTSLSIFYANSIVEVSAFYISCHICLLIFLVEF